MKPKIAELGCSEGHAWLWFVFDGDKHSDSWAYVSLGRLSAKFDGGAPFIDGCPFCGSKHYASAITDQDQEIEELGRKSLERLAGIEKNDQ